MLTLRLPAAVLAAGLTLAQAAPSGQAPPAKPAFGTFGIDTAQMDPAVKPGDDFFRYVNGKWLATATIPADKARYGMFDALRDQAETDVRALVDELGRTPAPAGSVRQKVADLYASWMDEARIEARGLEPLRPDLAAIDAATTKTELVRLMGRLEFSAPFAFGITADPAEPTRYVVTIGQAGLGMPVRDYYLSPGAKFDGYRAAYRTYVTRIFELLGDRTPAESAATVIALETKLAEAHWPAERRRDVKATNNPMDRAGLATAVPAVDWQVALEPSGLGAVTHVVLREVSAIQGGAALLDSEPLAAWKKYLAFHVADDATDQLPKAFDEASFAFHSKALRGVEVQRERWKRGIDLLDTLLGEGVGELYVAKYFPPGHKAAMDALVANLRTAMGERLKTLAWMDDKTRAEAQRKLATFEPRIGYPSKWRDYSAYTVDRTALFENVRRGRAFAWQRRVVRLGEPVDRAEWGMRPQTVNASYNASMNQLTFPAAILQPPFFDPAADPAVNYGGIGAVIGHEMGHGFDDSGRQYDEAGRIRNWWTDETSAKFVAQTDKLAAQYNAFCPLPETCVNGKLTMGENIGDLGGLEMAYTAYKLSLGGKEAPVLGGLTGDQRFFLAHAQIWRAIQRDDALRNQILTDPHAPPAARGSIPERNIDAWYTAFGVKPGDKAYLAPDARVHIW
ncbi:MAG TPA: M13 family metallopeptidase [Vicinamibacterales bacterium]|nr:M13 family metallopeptidase [Vicinamibacterales bacterium]